MRIELSHIDKSFGALRANADVSLTIEAGSIHGLLGENGAGKSTLLKIMGGLLRPDAGEIRQGGRKVTFRGPLDALRAGIGVLHQEPLDFPALTVLETFLVGRPGGLLLPRARAARELEALAGRFGFALPAGEEVCRLSIGERQQLEVLRLLSLGANTLLLDEPTTGTSRAQQEALFAALRRLAAEGKSIVLVSHKLADVEALCRRVTILRKGAVVGREEMPAPTARLVEKMFGKALAPPEKPATVSDGEALTLERTGFGDHRLDLTIDALTVKRGEVVGLVGLEGSGQRLLLEVCAGHRPVRRGRVRVGEVSLEGRGPRAFQRAGIAYLPADRAREGLVAGLTIEEHVALRARPAGLFLRPEAMARAADEAIAAFHIRGGRGTPVERLSGGNQQRTQLALLPPSLRVLLMEHPTRGLDVASCRFVWEQLLARCRTGTAVVFASADLDEVARYSDRVVAFSGGRVGQAVPAEGLNLDRLGRMIGGEFDALVPEASA
jgi:general nucleoside transport system ATP-binding protein